MSIYCCVLIVISLESQAKISGNRKSMCYLGFQLLFFKAIGKYREAAERNSNESEASTHT